MAHDVAAFLTWAAEPTLDARKNAGLVDADLPDLSRTILAYMAYQNVWHGPASRKVRATGPLDPENMAKSDEASRDAGVVG